MVTLQLAVDVAVLSPQLYPPPVPHQQHLSAPSQRFPKRDKRPGEQNTWRPDVECEGVFSRADPEPKGGGAAQSPRLPPWDPGRRGRAPPPPKPRPSGCRSLPPPGWLRGEVGVAGGGR